MKFNKDCEAASMKTQKTENSLKEKEDDRQKVQGDKIQLEKRLADMSQRSLAEQALNYNLTYKHKQL